MKMSNKDREHVRNLMRQTGLSYDECVRRVGSKTSREATERAELNARRARETEARRAQLRDADNAAFSMVTSFLFRRK